MSRQAKCVWLCLALGIALTDPAAIAPGDGVYKTTDGGKTWTHIGLVETQNVSKIRVHPSNPDIVFVAAFGHHAAPNNERGIFRSKDGGKTWEQVLFRDPKTGGIEI